MSGKLAILVSMVCLGCATSNPRQVEEADNIGPENPPELRYEEQFERYLLGTLISYDKTYGTDFRDTPLQQIEGDTALYLLQQDDSEFGTSDPADRYVRELLQRPGAMATLADVPDSGHFSSAFLFVPVPLGEDAPLINGKVYALGHKHYETGKTKPFSECSKCKEFRPLGVDHPTQKHVIFFGNDVCTGALKMHEILSELPAELHEVIYFVDGLKDPSVSRLFDVINGVPLLLVVEDEIPQDIFYGTGNERQLQHFMARNGFTNELPPIGTTIRNLPVAQHTAAMSTIHHIQAEDLSSLNLSGASLRRSTIGGTDLRGADLRGADVRDAIFSRSNLEGANLEGAKMEGARFWNSICPDGKPSIEADCRL